MVDGIPDYKTMRKLARRHMEDHEPDRYKKNEGSVVRTILLALAVVLCLFVALGYLNQALDEIYPDDDKYPTFVEKYGLPATVAAAIIAFGVAIIFACWTMIFGRKIDILEGCFTKNNWVDYYFENVYQDQDQKGVE